MLDFFMRGGQFMWLLLILAIVILYISIRKSIELFGKEPIQIQDERAFDAILFWGIMSAVLGILSQVVGIYSALGALIEATVLSPQIVLSGFRLSFNTTIFGLVIFMFSALIWFGLRSWFRRLKLKQQA